MGTSDWLRRVAVTSESSIPPRPPTPNFQRSEISSRLDSDAPKSRTQSGISHIADQPCGSHTNPSIESVPLSLTDDLSLITNELRTAPILDEDSGFIVKTLTAGAFVMIACCCWCLIANMRKKKKPSTKRRAAKKSMTLHYSSLDDISGRCSFSSSEIVSDYRKSPNLMTSQSLGDMESFEIEASLEIPNPTESDYVEASSIGPRVSSSDAGHLCPRHEEKSEYEPYPFSAVIFTSDLTLDWYSS